MATPRVPHPRLTRALQGCLVLLTLGGVLSLFLEPRVRDLGAGALGEEPGLAVDLDALLLRFRTAPDSAALAYDGKVLELLGTLENNFGRAVLIGRGGGRLRLAPVVSELAWPENGARVGVRGRCVWKHERLRLDPVIFTGVGRP